MVVLRGIIGVATPPAVSIASVSGVTSSKEHVFDVALEHAALDGGANRDDFVRVHTLVGFLADEVARRLDDLRHARHAADEHQLVNILLASAWRRSGSP